MKDNKINIKVGYDKLTQDEINEGKDFNKLYKNYTVMKKSWIKSPSGLGGIASVVVIVTVAVTITVTHFKKQETIQPKKPAVVINTAGKVMQAPEHKFINPPIKGADIAYKTYTVNAEKGGELCYGAKTKIHIPKNCFVDKNGKGIKGNVAIKYREFHTPVDFFLSGIPMTYDSAGKQYTFQSAGMFDIRGSKDGEPIQVKQGSEIKVDMASVGKGTNYNMYELDTVKKGWVFTGKSKMAKPPLQNPPIPPLDVATPDEEVETMKNRMALVQQSEKTAQVVVPVKPKKADPNSYSFDVKADAKDFPELAIYKNVWFQVDAADESYNPKYADRTWDNASLKRKTTDTYVFTVSGDGESHSFIVHPVVNEKNYDATMKKYDEKYAAYQKSIVDQKAEEQKEEADYKAMLDKQAKEAQVLQEQYQKQLLTANIENGIENYFTVKSFGVWNSDCPSMLPQGAEFAAFFTDNKKDDLSNFDVFMIEKGKNALYIYHPGHPFCYDPNRENFAWCVNQNKEVAVLSPEEFQKIKERSGDRTFMMQVMDKKIQSQDDIKAMFKSFL
jgi:hypothetical protein